MSKKLIYKVINASAFPLQLTDEEALELFKKLKNNDDLARKTLIEHNMRLVVYVAKRFCRSSNADDIVSVGTIGLIKAVDAFDYTKGMKFSNFACTCIKNEIQMYLRKSKNDYKNVSLEASLPNTNDDDNSKLIYQLVIKDVDEDSFKKIDAIALKEKILEIAKKCLTQLEFKVICMRYGLLDCNPLTQQAVAEKLGFTRSYISQKEISAKKILKEELSYYLTAYEISGFNLDF